MNSRTIHTPKENEQETHSDSKRDGQGFIERGMESLASAEKSGEYFTHEDILADIDAIIEAAERKERGCTN